MRVGVTLRARAPRMRPSPGRGNQGNFHSRHGLALPTFSLGGRAMACHVQVELCEYAFLRADLVSGAA